MEITNAKEYLGKIKTLDMEIDARQLMIEELESTVNRATTVMSDMPRPACMDITKREKMLVKLIDMKVDLNEEVDRFVDYKLEVISFIRKLPNPEHRIILVARYIKYMSWDKIESVLGYKRRKTLQVHGEALAELEKIL